ncbi:MAG: ABC transporter ATP-binding protein [Burkholderiales bacterium]
MSAASAAIESVARQSPLFQARRAGKQLGGDRKTPGIRALEPLDLEIRPGEVVTLLGPSGCGKSTLLRMMAGLIAPSEGSLAWWGEAFHAVGSPGRRLTFVFQNPTLMPWARVVANVRLPLDLAGMPSAEGAVVARRALEQVGLHGFEEHYPRALSGGMQMRVSIARALVTRPDLLLMDEPFGALDEITRNKLDSELLQWRREQGLTIVFVTHSIYEAVFLSDRVLVMSSRPGRILREVAIDEPNPRDDAFRASQKFSTYCRELFALLGEASGGLRDATAQSARQSA